MSRNYHEYEIVIDPGQELSLDSLSEALPELGPISLPTLNDEKSNSVVSAGLVGQFQLHQDFVVGLDQDTPMLDNFYEDENVRQERRARDKANRQKVKKEPLFLESQRGRTESSNSRGSGSTVTNGSDDSSTRDREREENEEAKMQATEEKEREAEIETERKQRGQDQLQREKEDAAALKAEGEERDWKAKEEEERQDNENKERKAKEREEQEAKEQAEREKDEEQVRKDRDDAEQEGKEQEGSTGDEGGANVKPQEDEIQEENAKEEEVESNSKEADAAELQRKEDEENSKPTDEDNERCKETEADASQQKDEAANHEEAKPDQSKQKPDEQEAAAKQKSQEEATKARNLKNILTGCSYVHLDRKHLLKATCKRPDGYEYPQQLDLNYYIGFDGQNMQWGGSGFARHARRAYGGARYIQAEFRVGRQWKVVTLEGVADHVYNDHGVLRFSREAIQWD